MSIAKPGTGTCPIRNVTRTRAYGSDILLMRFIYQHTTLYSYGQNQIENISSDQLLQNKTVYEIWNTTIFYGKTHYFDGHVSIVFCVFTGGPIVSQLYTFI